MSTPKIEPVKVSVLGPKVCVIGPATGWPQWAADCPVVVLTQKELDALPEYSCTLPDSYKRPVSEGGRPWKRNLNFYRKFGTGDQWVRCEYIPDPDPKFLAIKNERVELKSEDLLPNGGHASTSRAVC